MQHDRGALAGYAESVAGGIDDAGVCLVRNDEGDVVRLDSGNREGLLRGVDHDAHRTSEDFFAVHVDVSADLGVEKFFGAPIGIEVPGEEMTGAVGCLKHGCSRTVGEQHRGVAVGPVGGARQRVGADEEHLVGSDGDQSVCDGEGIDESGTCRIDVECAARQAELALNGCRCCGHLAVGRRRGQHECVDVRRLHA